ncbi:MAG: alanine--tRNA ligase [Crenarchaeota archaeon]|nr:alanine--tRNA ligase [Thermoproteota archaeon]
MSKLATRYLQERGYRRYRCKVCGSYFWSLTERDICGDSPCQPYMFIGDSPVRKKPQSLVETRDRYLTFFSKRGHTVVPKYPVVAARWREDVFLVGASIYVFQPWVTSGIVPPPANPLVISQPCIRFTDIDIVGRSGRHLTGFEMMAHHAFNYPDKEVYWIEETVRLAHEFFTQELGIPEEEITYKESMWMGGGNAGECFEVLVRGLEVATLVFMHYKVRDDGSLEEMPMKIVDTGYGLERIYWLSTGLPNVYEAVFQDLVQDLRKIMNIATPDFSLLSNICKVFSQLSSEDLSRLDVYDRVCEKLGLDSRQLRRVLLENEALYVICDHARSLSWMVNDGVLPSNSGIGYLARLLVRRVLRYLEVLKLNVEVEEVFGRCMSWLSRIYPELRDIEHVIIELVSLEKTKFREAIASAKSYIEKIARRGKKITIDDLVKLYDAHGVPPELVADICSEKGIPVDIPSNFYSILLERKQKESRKVEERSEERIDISGIEGTRELFYEDPYLREFESTILRCVRSRDGKYYIILRETAFYPEGGGQPSDRGTLILENGVTCNVEHVFKVGNVIIHKCSCNGDVAEGSRVVGRVDWDRRYSLMKMHTGTHVLLQALRRVLGSHVWQAGAQKDVPYSRLDITHYKVPTEDEIRKVEDLCQNVIERGLKVCDERLVRTEAEMRYGARIYQGGFIPSPVLRIVKIVEENGDIYDVQACGGTHLRSTMEIGALKIVRVERLQEGVIRVIFTTGKHVVEHVRRLENIIRDLTHRLGCSETELVKKIDKILNDVTDLERKCRLLEKLIVRELVEKSLRESALKVGNITVVPVIINVEVSDQSLQEVAREVTSREGILLIFLRQVDSRIILQAFSSSDVAKVRSVRDIVRKLCEEAKCRGGGGETSGQAVFTGIELNNVLNIVKDVICKILSL